MADTNAPAASRKPPKKSAKKPATEPADAGPVPPAFHPQVHVRMDCHGLGDCFLLRIEHAKKKFFHVLIDCGVYKGTAKSTELMREVAQDIAATTGNKLDLLVVTHEHWDHMSGFDQASDVFAGIEITEVWQPWTEDTRDGLGTTLRTKYEEAKTQLVGLMRKADAARVPEAVSPRGLTEAFEVMSFFGIERPAPGAAGGDRDPYKRVEAFLAGNNPQYLSPGEVREVGGTGVKAFVLGPPASEAGLRKTDIAKADAFARKHLAFFEGLDDAEQNLD